MSIRIQCVAIDATDPAALARFWREVLGWRLTFDEADECVLEPPEGSPEDGVSPDVIFLRVPEAKQAKGRLHLDLRPTDQQAEVDRVTALGATRTDVGQSGDESWVVLADPEGNEFCILQALSADDQPTAP